MFASGNICETLKVRLRASMFSLKSKKKKKKKNWVQYPVKDLIYYIKQILFRNVITVMAFSNRF